MTFEERCFYVEQYADSQDRELTRELRLFSHAEHVRQVRRRKAAVKLLRLRGWTSLTDHLADMGYSEAHATGIYQRALYYVKKAKLEGHKVGKTAFYQVTELREALGKGLDRWIRKKRNRSKS